MMSSLRGQAISTLIYRQLAGEPTKHVSAVEARQFRSLRVKKQLIVRRAAYPQV